jgi:Peptidase M15
MLALVSGVAALAAVWSTTGLSEALLPDPHSQAAFKRWLIADKSRGVEFAAFERFLASENVAGVVPAWQMMRADADYAARCDLPAFAMPPRAKWAAIVPTLRLVRAEVVPVVGRVEVHSAWRSDELNACVNGASRSRHLAFAALDLIAPDARDKQAMFKDLCALHRRVGAKTRMGLGAYWDPKRPQDNRDGRFHIDASGYRTWGFDYTGASSGCRSPL